MKNLYFKLKLQLTICLIFAIFIFNPANFLQAQNIPKQFKNNELNCYYSMKDGMLNGSYQSFYANGIKKSQGKFENNNRVEKWTVWDSLGNKICERQYKNAFEFKQIFPVNMLNFNVLNDRDSNELIKDFIVKEPMVYFYSKIWRIISKENNTMLFENERLSKLLINSILNQKISVYDIENEEFTKVLTLQQISEKFDFNKLKINAFKIKEVCFMDTIRKISELRILGICPIAYFKNDTTKSFGLFWLYFPDIRKVLASEKIRSKQEYPELLNMDDIFVFRHFSSKIIKEDNTYGKEIKDYKTGKDIEIEAERINLKLIEYEHDFWMLFSKN